jgi:hypothetical protein
MNMPKVADRDKNSVYEVETSITAEFLYARSLKLPETAGCFMGGR